MGTLDFTQKTFVYSPPPPYVLHVKAEPSITFKFRWRFFEEKGNLYEGTLN